MSDFPLSHIYACTNTAVNPPQTRSARLFTWCNGFLKPKLGRHALAANTEAFTILWFFYAFMCVHAHACGHGLIQYISRHSLCVCVCMKEKGTRNYTPACVCLCACTHSDLQDWVSCMWGVSSLSTCVCVYLRGWGGVEWTTISHRLNVRNVRSVYGWASAQRGPAADPAMGDFDRTMLRRPQGPQERGAPPLHEARWQRESEDPVPFASRPGKSEDRISISKRPRKPPVRQPLRRGRFSDSGKKKNMRSMWRIIVSRQWITLHTQAFTTRVLSLKAKVILQSCGLINLMTPQVQVHCCALLELIDRLHDNKQKKVSNHFRKLCHCQFIIWIILLLLGQMLYLEKSRIFYINWKSILLHLLIIFCNLTVSNSKNVWWISWNRITFWCLLIL